MNRQERRDIAKQLVKLEKENNISEEMKMHQMEELVKSCSILDLLKIDEMIMKNF